MNKRTVQFLLVIIGTLFGTIAAQYGLIELSDRVYGEEYVNSINVTLVYAIIANSIIITFVVYLLYDKIIEVKSKNRTVNPDELSLDSLFIVAVENSINESLSNEEYADVLRIGTALSRPLWLSGRYDSRIKLGIIVEEIAAKLHDKKAQAKALIDDIGWTKAELGDYVQAVRHISHGVDIAKDNNLVYWQCKGLRHLGAINRRQGNYREARKLYSESRLLTDSINQGYDKLEMKASLNYALGLLEFAETKDIAKAEGLIDQGIETYKKHNDYDRWLLSLSIKANFYLQNNNLLKAKDYFREGLKISKDYDRKRQIFKNLEGLIKIAMKEEDLTKANELQEEADAIATKIGYKISRK